jgi:hypothetical protein
MDAENGQGNGHANGHAANGETAPFAPVASGVHKSGKQNRGNRSARRYSGGRPRGSRSRKLIEQDELLEPYLKEGIAPHVALLEIGRNKRVAITTRVTALASATKYFVPKPAPLKYFQNCPELGELSDGPLL